MIKRRQFLKNTKSLLVTGTILSIAPIMTRCLPTEPVQGTYYVITKLCTGCGDCILVCRKNAIKLIDNKAEIDKSKCTNCGDCQRDCKEHAIDH